MSLLAKKIAMHRKKDFKATKKYVDDCIANVPQGVILFRGGLRIWIKRIRHIQ